jgi:hypothetical protein
MEYLFEFTFPSLRAQKLDSKQAQEDISAVCTQFKIECIYNSARSIEIEMSKYKKCGNVIRARRRQMQSFLLQSCPDDDWWSDEPSESLMHLCYRMKMQAKPNQVFITKKQLDACMPAMQAHWSHFVSSFLQ